MAESKLTKHQKAYLVSELKELVDKHEVYEVDVNDYNEVLAFLTEMFNCDWQASAPKAVIDEFLTDYFKKELTAQN